MPLDTNTCRRLAHRLFRGEINGRDLREMVRADRTPRFKDVNEPDRKTISAETAKEEY